MSRALLVAWAVFVDLYRASVDWGRSESTGEPDKGEEEGEGEGESLGEDDKRREDANDDVPRMTRVDGLYTSIVSVGVAFGVCGAAAAGSERARLREPNDFIENGKSNTQLDYMIVIALIASSVPCVLLCLIRHCSCSCRQSKARQPHRPTDSDTQTKTHSKNKGRNNKQKE